MRASECPPCSHGIAGYPSLHIAQTLSYFEIPLSARAAAFLTEISTAEGPLVGRGFVKITNYVVKPQPGHTWNVVAEPPALEATSR